MMRSITQADKFTIRPAKLQELSLFLSLAEKEGWNPGLQDAIPFYFADPNGFFIGELAGEVIGTISAVSYGKKYGFIGFYIVVPQWRHHGYGIELGKKAMDYLGDRVLGIDGVEAQQENYQKIGFKMHHNNARFEISALEPINVNPEGDIVNLKSIPFSKILLYDSSILGFFRENFLQHWLNMSNAYGLGFCHQGQLAGYGVIRQCHLGWKIGPLFADNQEIALSLLHGLYSHIEQGPVFLDIPENNLKAMEIAYFHHMKKVFATARMYRGEAPAQLENKVFGITSFELG